MLCKVHEKCQKSAPGALVFKCSTGLSFTDASFNIYGYRISLQVRRFFKLTIQSKC